MVSFAKHEGGVDVNVSRRGIDRTESAAGTGVLVCSHPPHPRDALLLLFLYLTNSLLSCISRREDWY